jgi:hypothetical protein
MWKRGQEGHEANLSMMAKALTYWLPMRCRPSFSQILLGFIFVPTETPVCCACLQQAGQAGWIHSEDSRRGLLNSKELTIAFEFNKLISERLQEEAL